MVKLLQKVIPLCCVLILNALLFGAFALSIKSNLINKNEQQSIKTKPFKQTSHVSTIQKKNADPIITASGSLTICDGSSVKLTANDIPAGASIAWSRNGTPIPGASSSSYTVTLAGAYSVIAGSVTYEAVTVSVNSRPVVTINASDEAVCSGTPIQFNANATGSAPFTYSWAFEGGGSATGDNNSHAYYSSGCGTSTFTTTLTVTDANGCTNTATKVSSVKKAPEISFADNDTFYPFSNCHNNPSVSSANYTLKVLNTSASASCITGYSANWGDGTIVNNLTNASFPLSHTYTQLGAFNLVITATSSNGCQSTKTYPVANQSNPAGSLGTLGATTGLCAPFNSTVPFTITNWQLNSPGTTYRLEFGDGESVTLSHPLNPELTTATISHTYKKTSCPQPTFTATLYVINSCATTPYTAGNIQVQIHPEAQFTTSPNPVCIGNPVSFTNTTTAGSFGPSCSTTTAYQWDFGDQTSSSNTSILTSPNHTYLTPGDYTVTLIASNPCGPDTMTHVVKVNPLPVVTSTNSANICSGSAVGIPLTSNVPSTFTWVATNNSNVSGESTTQQSSATINNTLVNLTSTVQSVIYTVTPRAIGGACFGPPQIVTVTVNPAPPAVTTIAAINYCQGTTAQALTATGLTGNTVYWYTAASGGTGSNIAPVPNTATPGTTTYYVGQTSSTLSCESVRTLITVTVSTIPAAPVVGNTNINYCQGNTAVPLSAAITAGNSLRWYTVQAGGTALSGTPTPSTSNTGVTSYYVAQVNSAGCESPRTKIDVTVNVSPGLPVVTPPVTYCINTTAGSLTATADPGNTLKWYAQSSGGTGNLIAPTPLTTAIGNRNYYVSQVTPSGCESPRATINVNTVALPTAPTVVGSVGYCLNDPSTTLTAAGTLGNTLTWYSDPQRSDKLTTAPTPSTGIAGTFKFYVTQINSSGCESPASEITVTVNPAIANNVINGTQTICYDTQPTTLSQVGTLTGGTGTFSHQWQSSTDGTTWTSISNATSANYTPGKLTSTTQYRRIANSGGCSSTSNVVIVTVQGSLTHYDIGSNQTLCTGSTPALLIGELPSGGNGTFTYRWESSPNNSTWSAISGATGADFQPGALTTSAYYRRIAQSGDCSGTSNVVNITLLPPPAVNAVTAKVLCHDLATAAINFASSTPGNLSYNWTNDNLAIGLATSGTGNISSFIAKNTLHKPITATVAVTATISSGTASCPGNPATFTITVLPNVNLQAIAPLSVCAGSIVNATLPVSDAEVFAGSNVSYRWTVSNSAVGLASGNGSSIPSFTVRNASITDQVSTVTVTPVYNYAGNQCDGTSLTYTITVKPQPTVANAGPDAKVCGTNYTLSGNIPQVGTGTWIQTSGFGAIFTNAGSPNTQVTSLARGSRYEFTWSITNQDCSTSTDAVQLDVLSDITNSIKASNVAICPGETVTLLTNELKGGDIPAVVAANYTYSWESSPDGLTGWQIMPGRNTEMISVTPSVKTFYRRKVSSYQLCEVVSNVIGISLNATPIQASAGNNATLCDQTSYPLQGNDPGAGFTGTWTVTNGTGRTTFNPDANTYNAVVNGLQPGNSYILKWTITNGTCGTTSASVTLNDLKPLTNTLSVTEPVICAGLTSLIQGSVPTGGTGNYQYSWQSSTDNQNWAAIPAQTAKDLNITLSGTSYLRRIVISGTCTLESTGVLITVKPAIYW